MSPRDSEFWARARRARDQLEEQYMQHPDVTLIDIGYAPDRAEGNEQIVLRVHVRQRWTETDPAERVAFPGEVAGIPVVVVPQEFRLD
ncbi:MAG: hypothetical protein PVH95_06695 [Anaerolineae bacterium]|jgi:hypothetical protein